MNWLDKIKDEWRQQLEISMQSPWFMRIAKGELGVEHYRAYLKESYYHAGKNPQIQTYATIHFTNSQRDLAKRYYQHAIAEIGHDLLALNDYQTLGGDAEAAVKGQPLPATQALIAFGFYQVQFNSPFGYLGYLFHLEFMPTMNGRTIMDQLGKAGIPKEAMTFIEEHATVDVQHNKLMQKYVEQLVHNQKDCDQIIAAAHATCILHCNMIFSAFESAESQLRGKRAKVA